MRSLGLAFESVATGASPREPGAEQQLAAVNSELVLPVQWESSHSQGRNPGQNALPFSLLSPILDTLYEGFQPDQVSFQRKKEGSRGGRKQLPDDCSNVPGLARVGASCLVI